MDLVVWEWLNFALRWLHVIAGISWIGTSFYFVHLDQSLRRAEALPAGAAGETWQVHGGGFYRMVKYQVAPAELPAHLTWFKWEAYTTWISGFFLMGALYYRGTDLFMIDPAIAPLSPSIAVAISVGSLLLGWVVYDLICRALQPRPLVMGIVVTLFVILSAVGFAAVFSGRAALLQTGALVATVMSANVAMIIIPNQRKVVASLIEGEAPDPRLGAVARQRSLHNSYLTLPVIFLMLSNHTPLAYATIHPALVVAIVVVVGAAIRHWFIARHADGRRPDWVWAVAAIGMAALVLLSWLPIRSSQRVDLPDAAITTAATEIIVNRCSMCHAAEPVWPGLATAPRGVHLDTSEAIARHVEHIRLNAVLSHAMPPGNVTEVTVEERATLDRWSAALLDRRD